MLQHVLQVDYDRDRFFGRFRIHVRGVSQLTPAQLKEYTPGQIYGFGFSPCAGPAEVEGLSWLNGPRMGVALISTDRRRLPEAGGWGLAVVGIRDRSAGWRCSPSLGERVATAECERHSGLMPTR